MPQANILLITTDQQHYSTLGATNPRIKTPHLDRLAQEGTRFDRAYCVNPTCTPSRATLITGMYPAWHGGWAIGVKTPEDIPFVGDGVLTASAIPNVNGDDRPCEQRSVPRRNLPAVNIRRRGSTARDCFAPLAMSVTFGIAGNSNDALEQHP